MSQVSLPQIARRARGSLVAGVALVVVLIVAPAVSPVDAGPFQQSARLQQDAGRPTYDLVHSSDPDRPGVGVTATEEVVVSGGEAPGSAPAPVGSASGGTAGQPEAVSAPVGRPQQCDTYTTKPRSNSIMRSLASVAGRDTPGPAPVGSQDLEVGRSYGRECRYADDGSLAFLDNFVYSPASPSSSSGPAAPAAEPVSIAPRVDVIARQVYAEIPLALPVPHTSPPVGSPQLVGLPVWLWLEDTSWASASASASVAGVTVTVIAAPRRASWDMGDGTTVTCHGPGTPWTGDANSRTTCKHTYQHVSDQQPNGKYQAGVTVTWSVSWYASTGEAGSLPAASRTTPFELDVRQRQAVITHGR